MTTDPVVPVLEALHQHGTDAGLALAEQVTGEHPGDELAGAVVRRLRSSGTGSVYTTPTGFRSFIDNRSNVALYEATITTLRDLHASLRPRTVVDLGAGDGRVTAATIDDSTTTIHLVEPATDLIDAAITGQRWPTPPVPHRSMAQDWLLTLSPTDRFDLVQSTFALHTIPTGDRAETLGLLRRHSATVAVVEFDVPTFVDGSRQHAEYAVDRYRRAVAEYRGLPDAIDGFLIPVLLAQFDPGAERMTYEQPADRWADDFTAAGFDVGIVPLHDYWWAPAFLLNATPR